MGSLDERSIPVGRANGSDSRRARRSKRASVERSSGIGAVATDSAATPSVPAGGGPLTRLARLIQRLYRTVRLTPFDVSTERGRSAERNRRATLSALASAAGRVVSLVTLVITVPIALGYLGPDRYGLVVTITALTAMLSFADFGLGNGLMNLVAAAIGRGDLDGARRSISSAFVMLVGLAAILAIPAYVLLIVGPWASVMNVGAGSAAELQAGIAVFLISVILNLPVGVVQRVELALQQGFVNSLWNAIGSLATLVGIVAAASFDWGLVAIVASLVGGPLVANALNSAHLFFVRRPDLRPRLALASLAQGARLARVGALFFVLQVTVAFAYQSDVVVATSVIGPAAATDYAVTFRLFMIVPSLVAMFLVPLWPAYSEALSRGDLPWVKRTLRLSVGTAVVASTCSSLLLVAFGSEILQLWVGPGVRPTLGLLLGMGVWAVLYNTFSAVAMLLNGASVMRFQVITALTMAVTSPVASILLGRGFGVAGVIWGTVLAHIACSAIPTVLFLRRFLRGLDARARPLPTTPGAMAAES
jgi:O-antigen/teichoic acid export membrane protein